MAAAVSDPSGSRVLFPTTISDQDDLQFYMERAEGEVGGMRSGILERGGSFTPVDHDKMTVRQCAAARRQMRIQSIRALVVQEDLIRWQTLTRYWSPACARVGVERARSKPGSQDSLAPLSAGDRELRLVALYPFTPAAQAAGEKMAKESWLKERSQRVKVSHLRVVGTSDDKTSVPTVVDAPDGNADVAPVESAPPATTGYQPAEWKPRALSPDELRDWAVRAIRDAERRKDVMLLSDIRVQAVQAYALAQDAYVRARRVVKGKDGEEKRQEAAERWRRLNVDQRNTEDRRGFIDALESSSRIRSA